jgi:hypothetical protein
LHEYINVKYKTLTLKGTCIAFKASGKDWENILEELHMQGFTHRTKENIKSLYSKVFELVFITSSSATIFISLIAMFNSIKPI